MSDFIALNENLGDFLTFGEDGDPPIFIQDSTPMYYFEYEKVHQSTITYTKKYTGILRLSKVLDVDPFCSSNYLKGS